MALCTLDNVKEHLGITGGTDESDTRLENIIDRVSKWFDSYCDRVFESDTYTEDYDGDTRRIALDHYPITSVTSVTDRGHDWTDDTVVSGTYYKISNNSRHILFSSSATLTRYKENIRIVYVAGYSTIPYDLVMACIEEVVRREKRRMKADVSDESKPDGSSYSYLAGDLLPQTIKVLDRYKNRSVV